MNTKVGYSIFLVASLLFFPSLRGQTPTDQSKSSDTAIKVPKPLPVDLAQRLEQTKSRFQSAAPGVSVRGDRERIEYVPGHGGLILAAAHGGRLTPDDLPDRTDGVLKSDTNVDKLALAVRDEVDKQLQSRVAATRSVRLEGGSLAPHLILCHLHRKKLDANRPLDAACAVDSPAALPWYEYQAAIEEAKRRVTKHFGRGLFIEIHGHGHTKQRLELGYLLREQDFELPAANFNTYAEKTSVREILQRGQVSTEELIRGKQSLGGMFERHGIPAIPSDAQPKPGDDLYFNGGWNTMLHGSRDQGTISSIQIECHLKGIRDTDEAIRATAEKFAIVLADFLMQYYPEHGNMPRSSAP